MDAKANVEFEYDVGEFSTTLDLVSAQLATTKNEPFTMSLNMDASVAASATMSLNAAASAKISLCLGPTDHACITFAMEATQSSAAGFDAIAGVSLDGNPLELVTLYTDEL